MKCVIVCLYMQGAMAIMCQHASFSEICKGSRCPEVFFSLCSGTNRLC